MRFPHGRLSIPLLCVSHLLQGWTDKSTLWQVLVSIQSAILGSEFPYYNEPGVESQWGTPAGEKGQRTSSNGGYEYLRVATIQYGIVGQLRNPTPGFEDAIREHFRLKRDHIEAAVERWLDDARNEPKPTPNHLKMLEKQIAEMRKEFAKL